MKEFYLLALILMSAHILNAQSIGIGTATPASSALLEVKSTTKGFLPPRLTIAQRDSVINPALGLVIFCTECDELEVYNGTVWKSILGTVACQQAGPSGIKICNQTWMQKNLDVSKYQNGDVIPKVTDPFAWGALTTGAWSWYNNDSATYGAIYGKMYNWYALADPRGLAPRGWHLPTDAEWSTLVTCLGDDFVAGGFLKEAGTVHWLTPNSGADNSSGFTALPGGFRYLNGAFNFITNYGNFWTTTSSSSTEAMYRGLNYSNFSLYSAASNKLNGFSVRCVKD